MTIALLTLIMLMAGCVSAPVEPKNPVSSAPLPAVEVPGKEIKTSVPKSLPPQKASLPADLEPYTTGMDELRLDLSVVLQGIYYRLTGSSSNDMGPICFAEEVGPLTDGTGVSFEDFALRGVSVRVDRTASQDPFHRRVDAVFKLENALGRQAYVSTAADYLIGEEKLLVRQALVIPHHPGFSDIRFLVVPTNRLPSLGVLKRFPLDELFRIASENAMHKEELTRLKKNETGRYKLLAFNMVRGMPEDQLKIYISEKEAKGRATGRDRIFLNDNGWSAAVVDGSFQFNSIPAYTFHVGALRDGKMISLDRFQSVIKP